MYKNTIKTTTKEGTPHLVCQLSNANLKFINIS